MSRFDIARLRKEKGISQGELASQLQINQSFLSAIENGRSPLPVEKEERLLEIFNLDSLDKYLVERDSDEDRKINDMTDSDLFNQLLNRFHKQAHSLDSEHHHHHEHHERIDVLQKMIDGLYSRNDQLMERNDRLSKKNDLLREEIDAYRREIDNLREEIFRLKSR